MTTSDTSSIRQTRWRGIIAVEGQVTDDGRLVEPTALHWPDGTLEIPLLSSQIVVGCLDRLTRRDDGTILGEGYLLGTLPEHRDLSVYVDQIEFAGAGLDYPFAITSARVRQIIVGEKRVWEQCFLEVLPENQS